MQTVKDLVSGYQVKEKPVRYHWQELALKWKDKFKISGKNVAVLFKLFKKNPDYMERLFNMAWEAAAPNPIGYVLVVMKSENEKRASGL